MFKYILTLTFVLLALVSFNVSYSADETPLDKTYEAHGGLNYETPFDKLQKVTELLS